MLKFSASVNFMFAEVPFLQRFSAAAGAGLKAVEIQIVEAPAAQIRAAAADVGIEVVLVNVDMGDLLAGGPGLSGVPGREAEFLRAVAEAAQTAEEVGSHRVHLGPSLVPEGVSREQCEACYLRNVHQALQIDAFASGRLQALLEPMNPVDMPTALFRSLDQAVDLLQREFPDQLGLQFDIYHVARAGDEPLEKFRLYQSQISHIQFSDAPARGEPGTGSVDFASIFGAIKESSYQGWTGAEYFPSKPTSETLDWLGYAV